MYNIPDNPAANRTKQRIVPRDSLLYYILFIVIIPISFVIHGFNENFGLINLPTLLTLLFRYVLIVLVIAFFAKILVKSYSKALVLSFVISIFYFLFGAFKDFSELNIFLQKITKYIFLGPALVVFIIFFTLFLKKPTRSFVTLTKFIQLFLIINLAVEIGFVIYNVINHKKSDTDFGDSSQLMAKKYIPSNTRKPKIFWLVFDEYPASSTLKKVWNFNNPLDSSLKAKGFYVADGARSNYNFTHYSLCSTLDMVYLDDLASNSIVTPKDMVKGLRSLYETNVVEILKKAGYAIKNYTIYDIKDHPSRGDLIFKDLPASLIDFQTFGARVKADIGWNFSLLLKGKDSSLITEDMDNLDKKYKSFIKRSMEAVSDKNREGTPEFFMFHFMLPHEPFIYNADGSKQYKNPAYVQQDFIPHLRYTNSVVNRFADTILSKYKNDDIIIVIQGDHGFKFEETDPSFETESCKIFYAVYCTDRDYRNWYSAISSVNSFRIIFNKYLQTNFPVLQDTCYNLFYRRK